MLGAILLAALLLGAIRCPPLTRMRGYLDLAFMGAAFLLLETENIVQFALLFGSTWFVNSLVFAAVLLTVYLAVETASRVKLPPPIVLYRLIGALVLAWIVPQESLLSLSVIPLPGQRGARVRAPRRPRQPDLRPAVLQRGDERTAFAANLLGAMVGGALEYLSLVTGYRFLLIVVGVLYALAFIADRMRLTSTGGT